jgi:hypothetical protein
MKRLAALLCLASAVLLSLATLSPLPAETRHTATVLYLMVATLQAICVKHIVSGLH